MIAYGFLLWRSDAKRGSSVELRDDGTFLFVAAGYNDAIRFTADRASGGAFSEFDLLDSKETLNYASPEDIRRYFASLEGVVPGRISRIDGISGASATTEAIRDVLYEAANVVDTGADRVSRKRLIETLISLFLFVALALFSYLRMRNAILITGAIWFVVFGVVFNAPLSAYAFFMPMRFLPVLAVIVLSSTLFYRNLYCNHLCPFGFLQQILRFLPVKKRLALPSAVREGGYVVLGVVIFTAFFGRRFFLEPYAFLFSRKLVWWLYLLPGSMLVLSLFIPRLWCRAFCPVGVIMRIGRGARRLCLDGRAPTARPAARGTGRGIWISAFTFALLAVCNVLLHLPG